MTNRPDLPDDHPVNQMRPDVMRGGLGKFEAKLTAAERCAVLAAQLSHISIPVIAAAFNINRRTVSHICSSTSSRYKSTRAEVARLGEREFIAHYFTESVAERIHAAKALPEVDEPQRVYAAEQPSRAGIPNRRATLHQGVSTHRVADRTHRIEVVWLDGDADYVAGWYSRLLDTDMPDHAFGDPDAKSHITSNTALKWAKVYLEENFG